MRISIRHAILYCIAATTPSLIMARDAPVAAPSFWDLESHYPHDVQLGKTQVAAQMNLARSTLDLSVPPGTPIATAEARLQRAGASCRMNRHRASVVKCLYHQYDLSDGAADDIRWTVAFQVAADNVTDLSVDRYVDRHGSN